MGCNGYKCQGSDITHVTSDTKLVSNNIMKNY